MQIQTAEIKQTCGLLTICHSTHYLRALISPCNKNEAKNSRETGKKTANEQTCPREDRSSDALWQKSNFYLHNLHKLLWRHITRFVSALRRRSLPPVIPRGEGTATRRLRSFVLIYVLQILKGYADKFDRPESKHACRPASPGREVFWIV